MLGSRRAALSEPDAVRAAASGMAGSVSPALLGILQTTARLQEAPTPERPAQLREQFDELFSTVTGYDALDQRIAKTKADKTYLLMVLEHPEIPLHNNPAELDARLRVRRRLVGYGANWRAGGRAGGATQTRLRPASR